MQVSSDKADRQKAMSEPSTRELLRRLVVEQKALTPEVGLDGRLHYAVAEAVLGNEIDTRIWITQMMELGMLKKSSHRDMVMCPAHLRVDPMVQLECTKCKARSIRKSTLVEHVFCGYMEADIKFNKEGFLVF